MTRDFESDSPLDKMCSFLPLRVVVVQTKKTQVKIFIGRDKKYANVSNPSEITPVDGILIKTHHTIPIVGVLTKKRVRHDVTNNRVNH